MTTHANKTAHALLGLALALAFGASFGQGAPPQPPDHPLTLQECVRIAVEQNPSAAPLLQAGRAALAKIGASQAAYWPTVNFAGVLQRSYSEPQKGSQRQSFLFSSTTTTSDDASLTAQYTLWDSGVRKATVEGAKASYAASDATFQATVQDLALSVQTAFYGLQGALWNKKVADETQKQTGFHLSMAQEQHDVGLVPLSDVLQAATSDANAKLAVIQAANAVTADRAALASLMGLSADTVLDIRLEEPGATLPELPAWHAGRDRALSTLPEIRAAFESSEALRFAVRETQASYLPSVTANGTAGLFDAGTWPDRQEWSAGLTLRIPVFTGFARKYQVLQAKEAWESSKMTLESTKLAAEKTAYDAHTQLDTALQAVSASKALVKSAQENSDVAEGQYQNGLGSMTNVVDATLALSNAKYQLIAAHLAVYTAQASWNRATGVDLLEGIASTPTTAPRPNGEAKP